MKLDDLKKMINESINEVDFEDNIIMALDNIETWARNAKRQITNKRDPQIFHRLVKAIADKATVLLQDHEMTERVDEDGQSYSEKEEIYRIERIKDAAEKAWYEQDPVKIKNFILHIHNLAEILIDMHSGMSEGYGSGNPETDPKSAGRWKVHYPSEKDWNKNKKSLGKVFEDLVNNQQHRKKEVEIYKAILLIAANLIKLHRRDDYDPDTDDSEEFELHKKLKKAIDSLADVFQASPFFKKYE